MATRWYFPATASNTSGLTPSFDAGWNYNSEAARADFAKTKGSSAIAAGTLIGAWTATAGQTALDRQFISAPLAAQTISGTFSLMLMTREGAGTDNVDRIITGLYVVNSSGTKVATLKTIGNSGTTLEFVANATHRTHTGANAAALTSYSCALGDRIVAEIGYSNSGSATTPEASAKWGENATDATLADNATTADRAGWIEFSANLAYAPTTFSTSPDTLTGTSTAPALTSSGSATPATFALASLGPALVSVLSTSPDTWTLASVAPTVEASGGETGFATTPDTLTSTSTAPLLVSSASASPSAFTYADVAPSLVTTKQTAPDTLTVASVAPALTVSLAAQLSTVTVASVSTSLSVSKSPSADALSWATVAPTVQISGPVSVSTTPDALTIASVLPSLGAALSLSPSTSIVSSIVPALAAASTQTPGGWSLTSVSPTGSSGGGVEVATAPSVVGWLSVPVGLPQPWDTPAWVTARLGSEFASGSHVWIDED